MFLIFILLFLFLCVKDYFLVVLSIFFLMGAYVLKVYYSEIFNFIQIDYLSFFLVFIRMLIIIFMLYASILGYYNDNLSFYYTCILLIIILRLILIFFCRKCGYFLSFFWNLFNPYLFINCGMGLKYWKAPI